ncbi:GtrA family protein [Undibacterium parvum]|uniref:GtrA family protein n=2 Tax=Undibacterium TaxID=401469 RepID=A0A6M4A5G5_9BURK|nr:GtrA family protein [Undibacterium parvum]AZP11729.1 GtrA family protein [Undibacterium parvum]QJQ06168.1 GtrA family protein [Undibacterium piscinae]
MRTQVLRFKALLELQLMRYLINGVVATMVHFGVLQFNLKLLHIPSAGIANFIAAFFGITVSFLGSRYYVFQDHQQTLLTQASKFLALYAIIACFHGLLLYVWSDLWGYDYRIGFLLATALQVSLSYIGNKFLVFKK